jgi:drug/metabolite transporter (DMT)-like permease
MLFLALSMLTSTLLIIILKSFAKFEVNTFQAIVVNYWVCTLTGSMIENYYTPMHLEAISTPWFYSTLMLGVSFIVLFNLMGYTAQKLGLTVVSVSNKLSLIIPVSLAFFFMNEKVTALKILSIVMALAAVVLVTFQKNKEAGSKPSKLLFILPIVLFLGSGFNDSLVNHIVQTTGLMEAEKPKFVIWIFQVAAILGTIILIIQLILKQQKFALKNIIAGVCLGVPNYFSMYYLVKALADSGLQSSVVFPINNVAIVIASAISGIVLFTEKLTKLQIAGILLACISIVILAIQ